MRRPRSFWGRACVVVMAALFSLGTISPTTAFAQQSGQSLSREDARVLGNQLNSVGQPSAAREIALGLLRADPADISALIILSRAELRLGNVDAARQAVDTAWRNSDTNRERFVAALVTADILSAQARYTRSQFWVRRAIQNAPDVRTRQVAIEAFRRVRQENPLAIEVRFGLTPSSNVNSGNSNETISFAFLPGALGAIEFQVPPDQRPLSGLEVSLQTDFRYRIASSATSRTSLEFGLSGRTYIMSDDARATAPDVTGESLSYAKASVGVLHQWVPTAGGEPYSASLTLSHDLSGGAAYSYELDGTLGTRFRLNNNDTLDVSGSLRYAQRVDSDTEVMTYSLRGQWSRALDNDDLIGITAQLASARSDATDLAYDAITLGVSYDFGDVIDGIDLSTSYSEQLRIYETSAFDPAGREDRISAIGLNIGLQNIDFYGFQPVVTVQAQRTDSSVPRFDTEGVQMGLNLRSSF